MTRLSEQTGDCFCLRAADVLPLDEVVVPEATAYLVHFCGLACFALWREVAIGYVEGTFPESRTPAGSKERP